jgi:DmsE family decaheme c-type cytochrome
LTETGLESDQLCLSCHSPERSPNVHGIFQTPHGIADDPRTPAAGDGCRSCHGDPGEHPLRPTEVRPEVSFGPQHFSSLEARNAVCLDCHKGELMHWQGGTHAVEDLACGDCHDSHSPRQPVLERVGQAETCYECHQDVRAQALLPSRHPLLEGQLVCTDCHAPHGSLKPGELIGLNLNDTCLGCHEDQRGPFLFEHPPASEDCSSCHVPHGAVHEPLLNARAPFLCQDCHVAEFHPSDLNSGAGLPGGVPNAALLGRNCMNCHPKVHGSNHPSGARLTR